MEEELDFGALAGAAGIGAVAGLRTFTAPALLSQAVRTGSIDLKSGPVAFLGTQQAANIATGLALGEMVGDKLPSTGDRIDPMPLMARAISGAVVGAGVCSARKKDPALGAAVGALAAIGAAYLGFSLRRRMSGGSKSASVLLGLLEDAVTIAIAVAVLRNEAETRTVSGQLP